MANSAVMSLVAGTDKNFFFVLPDYLESGIQFGALHPDLTPYPAFAALSATANILGVSEYKGRFEVPGVKATAQVFATPKGNVIVAWADEPVDVAFPTDKPSVRVANIFGDVTEVAPKEGAVHVKVGPEAVYVLDAGDAVMGKLTGTPRPRGKLPGNQPSRVVIAGHAKLRLERPWEAYRLLGTQPFEYTAEVYNFDEQTPEAGVVTLELPAGWSAGPARVQTQVEPMGRTVLNWTVHPTITRLDNVKIFARGEFGKEHVAQSVSNFRSPPSELVSSSRKPLEWTEAARWRPASSANGKVTVQGESDGLLFDAKFTTPGDRWAFPELAFKKPVNMTGFDGISFDLDVTPADAGSYVRMMLVEPNGAHYMISEDANLGKRRVVFLFKDFGLLDFLGPDPDGKLDIDRVASVQLGCNTHGDRVTFAVSNFELVKF